MSDIVALKNQGKTYFKFISHPSCLKFFKYIPSNPLKLDCVCSEEITSNFGLVGSTNKR